MEPEREEVVEEIEPNTPPYFAEKLTEVFVFVGSGRVTIQLPDRIDDQDDPIDTTLIISRGRKIFRGYNTVTNKLVLQADEASQVGSY